MRIALLFMFVQAVASVGGTSPPVVGTYGTLRYVEETGDVLGTAITILKKEGGYEVAYQEAEGQPAAVQHVPADVKGTHISFQLPPFELDDYNNGVLVGHHKVPRPLYRGTITERGLLGGFLGDRQELLPRQRTGGKNESGK